MPGDASERQIKHAAVVRFMNNHELDAIVLTKRANYAWYTGGRLNHVPMNSDMGVASLIITRDDAVCLASNIEAPRQAEEELNEVGIRIESFPWHDADSARRQWTELLTRKKVACDAPVPAMPIGVQPMPEAFLQLRWSLTDPEINRYRTLGREVAECLENTCRMTRPGITEYAVAARLAAALMERAIRPSVILVAADERLRRYRHPIPTANAFMDCGMLVCGGERDGLVISNSRVFSFKPIDDDLRRRHLAVCMVDSVMIDATRPGRTLGEVLQAAHNAYAVMGYGDQWQYHHQGGSTGYLGREVKAVPGDQTRVLVKQAFAWNPTIAGTKSEDTILVGDESNEILSITDDWPRTPVAGLDRCWPRCDILTDWV